MSSWVGGRGPGVWVCRGHREDRLGYKLWLIEHRYVTHTNVQGVFALTVALLAELRAAADAADPARVINIGSIDGLRAPSLENYSYSASKAAVHMLTRHLAKRLDGAITGCN